jgi:pyruvate/2-oxoglutarate/acetoin dehydrogenase E1 component
MMNVRDTIKDITRKHLLDKKSFCFGQCLTAVGWVGGTLPKLYEEDGMVEVTTADVANGGFVVGAGLQGTRPIYVVRYQGFQWYNAPIILNYACKSKEIWNIPCPIFIRSIAMEGGIGPVAGSSHHSLYHRMPGVKILSPMTPKEFQFCYEKFMEDDDVYYISEHRRSYDNELETENIIYESADFTLIPFSVTRFNAIEAQRILEGKGYKINIIHQLWIKPFELKNNWLKAINNSKYGGLVLDDDYEEGVASSIAHTIMIKSEKKIYTQCIRPRSAGFHEKVDNLPPSVNEIVNNVEAIIKNGK